MIGIAGTGTGITDAKDFLSDVRTCEIIDVAIDH
jgi:hypothetical protein